MADTKKAEKVAAKVTDADLAKSIEKLSALLENDGVLEEKVEKSVIGTDGGLQGETPSDGDINKDIIPDEQIQVQDPLDAVNPDKPKVSETEASVAAGDGSMAKSAAAEVPAETEDEEWSEEDEEFAKALVAAFEDDVVRTESISNDFAKSLTACTIEGLSITHSELSKSLSAIEERQSEKIDQLAKALSVMADAISAIKKEVVTVSNAPVRTTPKSAQFIEKSFGGENPGAGARLSKSQVAEALAVRVNNKKLDVHTLVKFESTGEIDPALLAEIQTGSGR